MYSDYDPKRKCPLREACIQPSKLTSFSHNGSKFTFISKEWTYNKDWERMEWHWLIKERKKNGKTVEHVRSERELKKAFCRCFNELGYTAGEGDERDGEG